MWFSWLPYDSFSLDVIACFFGATALLFAWKTRQRFGIVWAVLVYLGIMVAACAIQRIYLDTDTFGSIFGLMRMMCWFLFFFGPGAFFVVAKFEQITWKKNSLIGVGLSLLFVGIDAFLIEPNMLDITRVEIKDRKIKKKTRIVLLADIQTDALNSHTHRALKEAIQQNPDAVFFAGDYLQFSYIHEFPGHIKPFNQLLKDYGYDKVPLFVVEGDVENKLDSNWHRLFDGLSATIFERSGGKIWQGIEVIGLTMIDSKKGFVPKSKNPKLFSIVLGHNPNFSLSQPKAELYLAGHTHGGQVQIPFIGPLITLSDIPRSQAHGRTDFKNGSTMLVSRGIGMERYDAPRLRFFCRPEIIVVDLMPEN